MSENKLQMSRTDIFIANVFAFIVSSIVSVIILGSGLNCISEIALMSDENLEYLKFTQLTVVILVNIQAVYINYLKVIEDLKNYLEKLNNDQEFLKSEYKKYPDGFYELLLSRLVEQNKYYSHLESWAINEYFRTKQENLTELNRVLSESGVRREITNFLRHILQKTKDIYLLKEIYKVFERVILDHDFGNKFGDIPFEFALRIEKHNQERTRECQELLHLRPKYSNLFEKNVIKHIFDFM
jgi:hypothetical protein